MYIYIYLIYAIKVYICIAREPAHIISEKQARKIMDPKTYWAMGKIMESRESEVQPDINWRDIHVERHPSKHFHEYLKASISIGGNLGIHKLFWNKLTLPETNMSPENGWLEYQFPFWKAYLQGLC